MHLDITQILVALITAGLLKYAVDALRWLSKRRREGTSASRDAFAVVTADQSLAVVARARDELEADNARLRAEMAEKDDRHDRERDRWDAKEKTLRREIDTLERKVRDILDELEQIKLRHP